MQTLNFHEGSQRLRSGHDKPWISIIRHKPWIHGLHPLIPRGRSLEVMVCGCIWFAPEKTRETNHGFIQVCTNRGFATVPTLGFVLCPRLTSSEDKGGELMQAWNLPVHPCKDNPWLLVTSDWRHGVHCNRKLRSLPWNSYHRMHHPLPAKNLLRYPYILQENKASFYTLGFCSWCWFTQDECWFIFDNKKGPC